MLWTLEILNCLSLPVRQSKLWFKNGIILPRIETKLVLIEVGIDRIVEGVRARTDSTTAGNLPRVKQLGGQTAAMQTSHMLGAIRGCPS